jgi:hypothetical protein
VTQVTVTHHQAPPETVPYGTQMARRLSALPARISAQCSKRGSASGAAAGGAQLPPQTALPEDGYDAGVKKPVAVPNSRKVPSGKVWVTSKLQVTRSPCGLFLD